MALDSRLVLLPFFLKRGERGHWENMLSNMNFNLRATYQYGFQNDFQLHLQQAARIATDSLLAVLPALTGFRVNASELVCGIGFYAYQGACVVGPIRGVVVAPAPAVAPARVYGARPYYGAPGYGAAGRGANDNVGANRAGCR